MPTTQDPIECMCIKELMVILHKPNCSNKLFL